MEIRERRIIAFADPIDQRIECRVVPHRYRDGIVTLLEANPRCRTSTQLLPPGSDWRSGVGVVQ